MDSVLDLELLWKEYSRIIKDTGAILLFAQTPFDKVLGSSNLKMLRYEWIWQKTHPTGHLNAKKMPMKAHENILVFYKKLPKYNPQKTKGHPRKISSIKHKEAMITLDSPIYNPNQKATHYDSTERYPLSVLVFPSDKQKGSLHPTQKPVDLCEYLINTYTSPGDLVLDNCSGSGTTGLAAKNLNRNYIMIENNLEYYNISKNRVK